MLWVFFHLFSWFLLIFDMRLSCSCFWLNDSARRETGELSTNIFFPLRQILSGKVQPDANPRFFVSHLLSGRLRVVRAKAQSFPAGDVSVLVHRASKSAIWITCTFCTFHSGIPLCNLRWSISSPNVKQLAFQIRTIFLLQVRLRGGKYSTNCCTISVGVLRQCSAAYSVAGVMYVTCGCTCGGAQCTGEET